MTPELKLAIDAALAIYELTSDANTERAALERAMTEQPLLNFHGIGEFMRPYIATEAHRQKLRNAIREIRLCRIWLRAQPRRKTINESSSSYWLKHLAEYEIGEYVCNGAFIAASMIEGWKIKQCYPSSHSIYINISQKPITAHLERPPERRRGCFFGHFPNESWFSEV